MKKRILSFLILFFFLNGFVLAEKALQNATKKETKSPVPHATSSNKTKPLVEEKLPPLAIKLPQWHMGFDLDLSLGMGINVTDPRLDLTYTRKKDGKTEASVPFLLAFQVHAGVAFLRSSIFQTSEFSVGVLGGIFQNFLVHSEKDTILQQSDLANFSWHVGGYLKFRSSYPGITTFVAGGIMSALAKYPGRPDFLPFFQFGVGYSVFHLDLVYRLHNDLLDLSQLTLTFNVRLPLGSLIRNLFIKRQKTYLLD